MSELHPQGDSTVSKRFLEDMGISVPDDAYSFYTENDFIIFNIQFFDEIGCSIVLREVSEEYALTEKQLEALKAANHYGPKKWELE